MSVWGTFPSVEQEGLLEVIDNHSFYYIFLYKKHKILTPPDYIFLLLENY